MANALEIEWPLLLSLPLFETHQMLEPEGSKLTLTGPAPLNLHVPDYAFTSDTVVTIG